MLKLFIRCILFLAVIFLVLSFTDSLFVKNEFFAKRNIDYNSIKGDIEIAFFGSSHAWCSYDPRVFENEFGVNSFNFGAGSQRLISTIPVIDKITNENNLQIAVVDIFNATISQPPYSERVESQQFKTLDYLELSYSKIRAYNRIYGYDEITNISPTIRNHTKWKTVFKPEQFILNESLDYYNGFCTKISFNQSQWNKKIKNKKIVKKNKLRKDIKLSDTQKQTIDEIINTFKEKSIPLIFINSPIHKDYLTDRYYTIQRLIKEYIKSKKTDYIDCNELWDTLGLNKFDFRDVSHLNTGGALKVSTYVKNYIKDNYKIKPSRTKKLFPKNRFVLIENDFNNTIAQHVIVNEKLRKETGLDKVVVYKVNKDRLEVLLLGKKDSLKSTFIKVEYNVNSNEVKNLSEEIYKKIKKNKFTSKKKLGRGLNYNQYEFKLLKLNCPFSEIKNFKIFIGSQEANKKVLELKTIKLHNNK